MTDHETAPELTTRFRKKPVTIEAWQWTESMALLRELEKNGMKVSGFNGNVAVPDLCHNLRISTLEGPLHASKDDWIIKGVKGEFYPCKPDIFALTYEVAAPVQSGTTEGLLDLTQFDGHTPGPWRAELGAGKYHISTESGGHITDYVLSDVNACLIAAAPSLLDAVRRLQSENAALRSQLQAEKSTC